MGNQQSGPGGGFPGGGGGDGKQPGEEKKKKWEPPAPPPRVGRKQRKRDAAAAMGTKLPTVTPTAKCNLRLLKLERVKDYLLMEEEFVTNQVMRGVKTKQMAHGRTPPPPRSTHPPAARDL